MRPIPEKIRTLSFALLLAVFSVADAAVVAVESVGITVSDLSRSIAFYRDVLDFTAEEPIEVAGSDYEHVYGVFGLRLRIVRMHLGSEHVELMQFVAPQGRPIPVDSRSNDRWFQHVAIITPDMERAYQRLRDNDVAHASSGPQRLPDWNPAAGGIRAFYFRDPDGNHLEILQFPEGKGDPKWHDATALFLGIDHTAIVVADTNASLSFYSDRLGMKVAGESENYGPEQERLNNVFGARLRITGLRAEQGPGVEFLEYLAPSDGRPMPADTRANDLWHWQINMQSASVASHWKELQATSTRFVSPGPVRTTGELGFQHALLVRDPDGHAVLLME